LDVTWIKGHNGSVGNERVDNEAKKAVKGTSSQSPNLPDILIGTMLLLSTLAMKQVYNKSLKTH